MASVQADQLRTSRRLISTSALVKAACRTGFVPKNVEGVSDWWAVRAVKEDFGGTEERMEIVFDEAFMVGEMASTEREIKCSFDFVHAI